MMMNNKEFATFAGGCFWCMVDCFYLLEGVLDVKVGYAGGYKENPAYAEVKSQTTGHYEVARVEFDPSVTSYDEILDMYWRQIDPTDDEGQFQDRGSSYRTAIFYENDEQREKAEASKKAVEESGKFNKPVVTKILPLIKFYPAEEYHQNFSKKSPDEYKEDRKKSGRDEFIKEYWT
jgi:peptide-methionine (S)-S-oxide reductase